MQCNKDIKFLTTITIAMTIGLVLNSVAKVITDLSGYLHFYRVAFFPCYWDTDLSGNLVRALNRLLVALPVLLGMALWATGVSISWLCLGISLTLFVSTMTTIASMSVSNNLRVVTNNSRAVVNLFGGCVALGGDCFLTLFNISCVNNSLADRAGNLALILYWPLVALPVLLVNTLRTSGVSRLSITLTITSMSMSHYLGVMANNSRAVVDLLRCFLTMSGDDVLTLLNISSVYNNIIFLMALLALILYWLLVALLVWLAEALKVVVMVVSRFSISLSFTLVVSNMSLSHYLRVMTNNSRAVVNLVRCFLAVLCDNILALLHISSVHHHIILLMTSLVIVGLASSV